MTAKKLIAKIPLEMRIRLQYLSATDSVEVESGNALQISRILSREKKLNSKVTHWIITDKFELLMFMM